MCVLLCVCACLKVTSCFASSLVLVVPAGKGRGCGGDSWGIRDANIPVRPCSSLGAQMNYTVRVCMCVDVHSTCLYCDTLVNRHSSSEEAMNLAEGPFVIAGIGS